MPSSGADAAGDMLQSSCRDSVTWKSLYDRERIRAEAAEARTAAAEGRCEELRMQEVEERSRTNSLKAIFESNREKLSAARAEVREVRRTAKQSLALKQEVARPGGLLAEAGARKRSTVVSLCMENAGLKTAMKVLKGRGARGGERQASFEQVVDVRTQEREEAAGVIEARPAARHMAAAGARGGGGAAEGGGGRLLVLRCQRFAPGSSRSKAADCPPGL